VTGSSQHIPRVMPSAFTIGVNTYSYCITEASQPFYNSWFLGKKVLWNTQND